MPVCISQCWAELRDQIPALSEGEAEPTWGIFYLYATCAELRTDWGSFLPYSQILLWLFLSREAVQGQGAGQIPGWWKWCCLCSIKFAVMWHHICIHNALWQKENWGQWHGFRWHSKQLLNPCNISFLCITFAVETLVLGMGHNKIILTVRGKSSTAKDLTRLCYLRSSVFFSNFHSLLKHHCSGSFPKPVVFTASFSLGLTRISKPFLPFRTWSVAEPPELSPSWFSLSCEECGSHHGRATAQFGPPCKLQVFGAADESFSVYSSQPQQPDSTASSSIQCPSSWPRRMPVYPSAWNACPHTFQGSHCLQVPTWLPLKPSSSWQRSQLHCCGCMPGSCLGTFRCSKLPEQTSHGACSLPFCKLTLT